MFITNVIL
jgi:translation initiation factor 5A